MFVPCVPGDSMEESPLMPSTFQVLWTDVFVMSNSHGVRKGGCTHYHTNKSTERTVLQATSVVLEQEQNLDGMLQAQSI